MAKYRKRPVVIEASRWFKDGDHSAVEVDPLAPEAACAQCFKSWRAHGKVKTLESGEGAQIVCPGDWVITGVKNEKYPCKDDVFQATYEPVGP